MKIPLCQYFVILQQSGKVSMICVLDCSKVCKYFRLSVALFFIGKMYCKVEQENISFSSTPKDFKTFYEGKI